MAPNGAKPSCMLAQAPNCPTSPLVPMPAPIGLLGILTTIVLIGFTLVTLLLVVTVMAITSVYVGERQLQSLADRAAGAAADTFTNVDRSGSGPPTPILTNGAVAASATSYLGTVGAFQDVSHLPQPSPTPFGAQSGVEHRSPFSSTFHGHIAQPFSLKHLVQQGQIVTDHGFGDIEFSGVLRQRNPPRRSKHQSGGDAGKTFRAR